MSCTLRPALPTRALVFSIEFSYLEVLQLDSYAAKRAKATDPANGAYIGFAHRLNRVLLSLWLLLTGLAVHAAAPAPVLPPVAQGEPIRFVVLGDNRGDANGEQSQAFVELLQAIREVKPAFVLNTGDMINGNTDEATAREQWRRYRETIAPLGVPTFHAPGNHDLWDQASGRLYRELWGPPYFTFDYGGLRVIGLDTESSESRLDDAQMHWLNQQLRQPGASSIFVFLHRPLFPVDGGIGSSLDVHPAERDALHRLFVQHRDRIKAVFVGHEHLYNYQERDGIRYYITGGGGADLYEPGELGGFHHYLLVRVEGGQATIELKKVGPKGRHLSLPRAIAPGTLLERWTSGLFWQTWNYTVTAELTPDHASEGQTGLQLNFDLGQCGWPTLVLPLHPTWDVRTNDAALLDVFIPTDLNQQLTLTPALETQNKFEFPSVALHAGWNTVRTELNRAPVEFQHSVQVLDWTLTAEDHHLRGDIVFDNLRAERPSAGGHTTLERLESWERPILWRVADETVSATTAVDAASHRPGVKVQFDFARCPRPVLLARLNPPWDLRPVRALTVDVFVPDGQGLSISLGFRAGESVHATAPLVLKAGWNHLQPHLDDSWVPAPVRSAVEQVEWTLFSTNQALRGWVQFSDLGAE